MKIAICFYGLVGSKDKKYGKGEALDPTISYKFYKKMFLNILKTMMYLYIHSLLNLKKT